MHRRALLMTAAAAALSACASQDQGARAHAAAASPHDFAAALYRQLAAHAGNQFVSPYSVSAAFALVYPGARGQTAAEIAGVLGYSSSSSTATAEARALADALQAQTGGSTFTLANAAWVERTLVLSPDYARAVRDELGATIEPVDFIANQPAALARINAWAGEATRGRIPQVLTTPDESRRLVLTNAVHFLGRWSAPFSARATRDGVFHADGADTPARLMRQTTQARYFDNETLQAAEFDYDDGAFALAVLLPREVVGLARFERDLSGDQLGRWLQTLTEAAPQRLDVTLPKLEIRGDYELSGPLQAMGMRAAFTNAADFSGITEAQALAISAVVHKTFLKIDEDGAEAAAVTAIDMVATAAPIRPPALPIEFKADRPFAIVLLHKPTGAILFMGRIVTTAA
ncbi:MAG: serpin family protein [Hyphomonadaceae bacterium]|nr:serpin family protein [Hyphomonadaceae bacterium]